MLVGFFILLCTINLNNMSFLTVFYRIILIFND